jgi:hypothetical protein
MEVTMIARLTSIGVVLLVFGIALGLQQYALAQQSQTPLPDTMKMHEQMMAEMKAADAKLDALVRAMNSATGEKKADAIAAVVNELVNQHKSMHGRMGQMHEQMMGRGMMMKH